MMDGAAPLDAHALFQQVQQLQSHFHSSTSSLTSGPLSELPAVQLEKLEDQMKAPNDGTFYTEPEPEEGEEGEEGA